MNPYLPVLIFLVFAIVVGSVLTLLSWRLGPRKASASKSDVYECGVPKVGSAREKMSVKFYLTAILFILFDIETIFLYLWAKVFPQLGLFGVVEVMVFIVVLLVGYLYVIRRGALEWDG